MREVVQEVTTAVMQTNYFSQPITTKFFESRKEPPLYRKCSDVSSLIVKAVRLRLETDAEIGGYACFSMSGFYTGAPSFHFLRASYEDETVNKKPLREVCSHNWVVCLPQTANGFMKDITTDGQLNWWYDHLDKIVVDPTFHQFTMPVGTALEMGNNWHIDECMEAVDLRPWFKRTRASWLNVNRVSACRDTLQLHADIERLTL
jgi:hypothetical protein